jgi:uncharacterized protein
MSNPFSLSIAQADNFCNREKEIQDLVRHARNGNNVLLYSPRRYGKTSLVKRTFDLLDQEGMLTVYVDLFPILSEKDMVSRLSSALIRGMGRGVNQQTLSERLKNLFKRVVPSIEIKPDGYSVSLRFDQGDESGALLEDVLEGLYRYVTRREAPACVALDEFQEITELPESKRIEGTFRSHIQLHREISYVFIGSRRRILKEMFSDKSRAFYKSAFAYPLREIPRKDFADYISARFERSGKICPQGIAGAIYDRVRGYPYYVQKLASIAWDLSQKECDPAIVQSSYRALIEMETADFEATWSALTLVQRTVLKALALESPRSPYSREFLERHGLSVGGTQRAFRVLLSMDLVEKESDGSYRVTDPVICAWIKHLNDFKAM